MTNQLLVLDASSNKSNKFSQEEIVKSVNTTAVLRSETRLVELTKTLYQADHQIEFFSLQAEAEALFQHLRTMRQQKLVLSGSSAISRNN